MNDNKEIKLDTDIDKVKCILNNLEKRKGTDMELRLSSMDIIFLSEIAKGNTESKCILHKKDFVVEDTMTVKQYKCRKCGYLHVIADDKYCCNCGIKIEWKLKN